MLKVLRAILSILSFIILIPVKIYYVIKVIICIIIWKVKDYGTVKEIWEPLKETMFDTAKEELHWIKTGKME